MPADQTPPGTRLPPREEDLRRDAVLEAIGHAAASLVSVSSTEDVIPATLEQLGLAVGVSRVVLDQYFSGSDGEVLARPLARWRNPGERLRGEVALPEPRPLLRLGLGPWLEALRRGDVIEGSPSDFPGPAGDILRAWDVQAFLAVPIIVEERLTGLLSLSECHRPRAWLRLEREALRVYANMIGSFLHRLESDRALRRSEERYRGLVESQRNLIVRWTLDFRLVFANEAYYRLFGLDRRAVLGQPILDSAPPEASEMIRELLETLTTPPFHVAHEQHGVTVEGRRWLLWESFPIHDDAGRIVEIQAMGRDITGERAVEEELLRRDRILAAVNAAAEHLLGSANWETVIAEVMERLGQATGVARVRFWELCELEPGRRAIVLRANWEAPGGFPDANPNLDGPFFLDDPGLSHLLDPANHLRSVNFRADEVPEHIAAMLRSRGIQGFLAMPVLVNDVWWGLMTIAHEAKSVPWSSGEEEALRAACAILGAVIHRQRIESSLRESEEKYRTLVEGANQPIIIVSHDGVVCFSNGFAAAALNLTAEQMVGQSMWSLFPREHADSHMRAIRRSLDSGQQVISTHRSVVRGRHGWFEARIQPLAGSWRGQRAALVIVSDVTERKATERRLLEYQSRLRSLSSELALAEQRERRRIASELHDRIGQTLAMARIKLGGVQQDGSDAVLDEVRNLLDQSIQDTRTLTFELSPPILHELGLEPALEWLLERFAARHSFSTSFHGDGLPVELPGDVLGLVFQSVQELLVNVAKHARARTVDITLDRSDGVLRLEVVDDGIGAVFSRAPRTGRAPEGFGLFSIRERLEHLGGSFTIDSQPGKGTRAQLRVPLRPTTPGGKRKARR